MKTVKGAVLLIAMAVSSTSLANTYLCVGLDDQDFQTIEFNGSENKLIGTLDGAPVRLSEDLNSNLVAMSVKQGRLVTVIQASPGPIGFHQNNGEKVSSVQCFIQAKQ